MRAELTDKHRQYLQRRGYTDAAIVAEPVFSLTGTPLNIEGLEVPGHRDAIGWECRSMAGALIGVQVRVQSTGQYFWYQRPGAEHLPIIYGIDHDHRGLYETGEVFLTEGVFDRTAIRRMLPGRPTYARLSKGVGKQLELLLHRYAKRIWLAFDQDPAGELGTKGAKRRAGEIETIEIRYPAKDPSELISRMGLERASAWMQKRTSALDW